MGEPASAASARGASGSTFKGTASWQAIAVVIATPPTSAPMRRKPTFTRREYPEQGPSGQRPRRYWFPAGAGVAPSMSPCDLVFGQMYSKRSLYLAESSVLSVT